MGTTIVAAAIFDKILTWASVGDSILPILSAEISKNKLKNHPQKHQLRSVLNGSEINLIDIPSSVFKLEKDDLILIASDGILSLNEFLLEKIIKMYQKSNTQDLPNRVR